MTTIRERLQTREGVADYCRERFDVEVPARVADAIYSQCRSRTRNIDCWLGTRLREHGCFRAGCKGTVPLRFVVHLHIFCMCNVMPSERWALNSHERWVCTDPLPGSDRAVYNQPYMRPSPLATNRESELRRAARRYIRSIYDRCCPCCKKSFRNEAALVLHMAENHAEHLIRVTIR